MIDKELNDEEMVEKELIDKVLFYNQKYLEGEPVISDFKYEQLIKKVKEINPEHKILNEIIDIENPKRRKIKHEVPMLSLDKVYSYSELLKWMKKVARNDREKFLLEPKYDGMAACYENGVLSKRGDGFVGEDISDKMPFIKILKNVEEIDKFYKFEELENETLRGELVILNSDFKNNRNLFINKKGEPYKIPRSAVAGLINEDETDVAYKGLITFINYDYEYFEIELRYFNESIYNQYVQYVINMNKNKVAVDGIVVKLKDKKYSESLGTTSHHPKGQIAVKLGNPFGETILKDIEITIGKEELIPVGITEPVEIEGVMNKRISLHNYQYIIDNDLSIGDTIIIERCGEIIPQLKEIIFRPADRKEITIPERCPYCNSKTKFISPHLYCTNENCEGKLVSKLYDSVVRLGIERLGKPTIEKLIKNGHKDILSILNLTKDDILKLEGFKDKSAENLLNNIRKIKETPIEDWRILASLNIEGFGKRISKNILSKFTLNELIESDIKMLNEIEGMSDKRSETLVKNIKKHKKLIDKMLKVLNVKITKNETGEHKMKTICFTGKADKKRSELISEAKKIGYEFINKVSKNLDILVTNDLNSDTSKMKKARKYGVKIITYSDFEALK